MHKQTRNQPEININSIHCDAVLKQNQKNTRITVVLYHLTANPSAKLQINKWKKGTRSGQRNSNQQTIKNVFAQQNWRSTPI